MVWSSDPVTISADEALAASASGKITGTAINEAEVWLICQYFSITQICRFNYMKQYSLDIFANIFMMSFTAILMSRVLQLAEAAN